MRDFEFLCIGFPDNWPSKSAQFTFTIRWPASEVAHSGVLQATMAFNTKNILWYTIIYEIYYKISYEIYYKIYYRIYYEIYYEIYYKIYSKIQNQDNVFFSWPTTLINFNQILSRRLLTGFTWMTWQITDQLVCFKRILVSSDLKYDPPHRPRKMRIIDPRRSVMLYIRHQTGKKLSSSWWAFSAQPFCFCWWFFSTTKSCVLLMYTKIYQVRDTHLYIYICIYVYTHLYMYTPTYIYIYILRYTKIYHGSFFFWGGGKNPN